MRAARKRLEPNYDRVSCRSCRHEVNRPKCFRKDYPRGLMCCIICGEFTEISNQLTPEPKSGPCTCGMCRPT